MLAGFISGKAANWSLLPDFNMLFSRDVFEAIDYGLRTVRAGENPSVFLGFGGDSIGFNPLNHVFGLPLKKGPNQFFLPPRIMST